MPFAKLILRVHAQQRMFERGIDLEAIRHVLANHQVIETYSQVHYLMLGWYKNRPLHVSARDNLNAKVTIILTCYEPSPSIWRHDFKTRK